VERKKLVACRRDRSNLLQEAWLERLAFGPTPLEDRLIQLWLGVFPVNVSQSGKPEFLVDQIETIRRHLHGSYTDLLTAMVVDRALLTSLNGFRNTRGNPNENLGRELLELFSLGEGHYGEADVIAAARALTGYRVDKSGNVRLVPGLHDDGVKTVLGRSERFDTPGLVAWLCEQPSTARNITARLWLQLVGPLPGTARLSAIARAWQEQGLAIPWLVMTLLESEEAKTSMAQGAMVRDPIDLVIASLALLGSRHPDALSASRVHLARMGQGVFSPPSVKGWPVNQQWLNLRWLEARRRGLQALLADEEVWLSRNLPIELSPGLTPIPPISLSLPISAGRDALAQLFVDPVWQLK
jgi:uncharacterized protein (DUF1800 family)